MNELEKIIGKPISEFTFDELTKFYENEEFLQYINEYRTEASEYVLKHAKDKDILDDFRPLYIESLMVEAQSEIGSIFKENTKKEKLVEALKKFEAENQNWEALLSLYLLVASQKLDYELPDIEVIKKLIDNELNDLETLKTSATNLLLEGLDLLHILQQSYFELTGEDLLKNNQRARDITARLDEELKFLFDAFQKSAEEKYPGLKPEDIGYIDITKLKGGEN